MTGVLLATARTMWFVITPLAAVLTALAVARITRFITSDFLFATPRAWLILRWGTNSKRAYLLTCPWCMSVWVGAAVCAGVWWWHGLAWSWWPLAVLAVSQVTGLLARWDEGA